MTQSSPSIFIDNGNCEIQPYVSLAGMTTFRWGEQRSGLLLPII